MSGDYIIDWTIILSAVVIVVAGWMLVSSVVRDWYADWREGQRVRDRKDALIALLYHQLVQTSRALGISDNAITDAWNLQDKETIRACLDKQIAPTGYKCFKFD